MIILKN